MGELITTRPDWGPWQIHLTHDAVTIGHLVPLCQPQPTPGGRGMLVLRHQASCLAHTLSTLLDTTAGRRASTNRWRAADAGTAVAITGPVTWHRTRPTIALADLPDLIWALNLAAEQPGSWDGPLHPLTPADADRIIDQLLQLAELHTTEATVRMLAAELDHHQPANRSGRVVCRAGADQWPCRHITALTSSLLVWLQAVRCLTCRRPYLTSPVHPAGSGCCTDQLLLPPQAAREAVPTG